MTDRETRAFVSFLYPGPSWRRRVANMPIDQVIAIYLRVMHAKVFMQAEPPPEITEPENQLRLF